MRPCRQALLLFVCYCKLLVWGCMYVALQSLVGGLARLAGIRSLVFSVPLWLELCWPQAPFDGRQKVLMTSGLLAAIL